MSISAGVVSGVVCDKLVRTQMAESPDALGWDDAAGFTAGTLCAIPAGIAAGMIGGSVDAITAGTTVVVGTYYGTRLVIPVVTSGAKNATTFMQPYFRTTSGSAQKAAMVTRKYGKFVVSKTFNGTKSTASLSKSYMGKVGHAISDGAIYATKGTVKHARKIGTTANQKWGSISFGHVAASGWRRYMPELYRKQKGRDALCDKPLPALFAGYLWQRKLNPLIEVDHIIPRSKEGHDTISNLQLTHQKYNRAKGNETGFALRQASDHFCSL